MNGLTPKQLRAVEALMSGSTLGAAAAKAGVSRRTLARWLDTEPFRAALRVAQDDLVADLVRRLAHEADCAIDALHAALIDDEQPALRLRAADVTLSKLLLLREQHDLAQRVAALEAEQYEFSNSDH